MGNGQAIEAVFIDRDGTLDGTGHFIHPRDFQLYPNAAEALELLKRAGVRLFAFTNQHRIASGEAEVEDFVVQFREYGFEQAYICPHKDEDGCACKKPQPGMLLQAAKEHNLDLSRCVVIGDVGDTDMLAVHNAGTMKVLVRTGWGTGALGKFRDSWKQTEPDYVAEHILEAAQWVVRRNSGQAGSVDSGERKQAGA